MKLVQRKTDGKIYALKSLIKSEMFKKDQLAHVRAERDILADSKDNPWLVKLHASFQDAAYLYLLMEFLPGGDLMTMLIKYEIFSEDITRFYMAEVVMAIEAVHKLGFLHRYVKFIPTYLVHLSVFAKPNANVSFLVTSNRITFSLTAVVMSSLLISVFPLAARRHTTMRTTRTSSRTPHQRIGTATPAISTTPST